MRWSMILLLTLCLSTFSCDNPADEPIHISETLKVYPVSKGAFIHESYLQTESFGKVVCNGLIYISDGEAVIFDTPADNATTLELMQVVSEKMGAEIKLVVPTHFHNDCLGGLEVVHDAGISSLANELTRDLVKDEGGIVPLEGFAGEHTLRIGRGKVILNHVGEGHTRDNIVGYVPDERVLFGGCLVKSVGAGVGFTGDANVAEWPNTLKRVKDLFPKATVVIPGHGKHGDQELLDFTIELFSKKE